MKTLENKRNNPRTIRSRKVIWMLYPDPNHALFVLKCDFVCDLPTVVNNNHHCVLSSAG